MNSCGRAWNSFSAPVLRALSRISGRPPVPSHDHPRVQEFLLESVTPRLKVIDFEPERLHLRLPLHEHLPVAAW